MASKVGNITFYANDPARLSEFWALALGYPVARFEGEFKEFLLSTGLTEEDLTKRGLAEDPTGEGPRLFFHHAAQEKAGRNRLHLDIQATPGRRPTREELDVEAERLVGLGASVVRLVEQDWGPETECYYQMRDPEGNEFCLQ